ncbi:MAG: transcription elongation factor [Longimicrobiales bacterium]
MPEKKTVERARKAKREGKAPSTQAGEYVREEIEHVREGKHGARSPEQAIAIGLSKARRSGVELPPPKKGKASSATRKRAKRDLAKGRKSGARKKSSTRSRATRKALKREGRKAGTKQALSRHARKAARKRTRADRSASARKGARKRTAAERSASARKAARTRARRQRGR